MSSNGERRPSIYFTAMCGDESQKIHDEVSKSIRRFDDYLYHAIKNLKKKKVRCRWERVNRSGWSMNPDVRVYSVVLQTEIRIKPHDRGWVALDTDSSDDYDALSDIREGDEINWGKRENFRTHILTGNDIREDTRGLKQIRLPDGADTNNINWKGIEFRCKPLSSDSFSKETSISISGNRIGSKLSTGSTSNFIIDYSVGDDEEIYIDNVLTEYDVVARGAIDDIGDYRVVPNEVGEYLIYSSEKPKLPKLIKTIEITDWIFKKINVNDILINGKPLDHDRFDYQPTGRKIIRKDDKANINGDVKIKGHSHMKIKLSMEKDEDWIQLLSETDNIDEDQFQSELDFFFDDDVSIFKSEYFSKENRLEIKRRDQEEKKILFKEPLKLDGEFLHLRPETRSLENQQAALWKLMDCPYIESLPLINLHRDRKEVEWDRFKQPDDPGEDYWEVLTDIGYDGCDKQREFVLKALSSPDFSILDGPPGTGKTTTIHELILKVISSGGRVLLAASTNAAINNILERIDERKKIGKDRYVHAVRLGNPERIRGVSAEYSTEKIAESLIDDFALKKKEAEKLAVETSNLVCGTMDGVNFHFNLNNDNGFQIDTSDSDGPPFDYLIVDECSKTTFQEFLVPARLARKWVLAGDIRQLSPFTDRGHIVANLDNLKGVKRELTRACFLLHLFNPFNLRIIIPTDGPVMDAMRKEIDIRTKSSEPHKYSKNLNKLTLIDKTTPINDIEFYNKIYSKKLIFIDKDLLKTIVDCLPRDCLVLDKDWLQSAHYYEQCSEERWTKDMVYESRSIKMDTPEKIFNHFMSEMDKTWSDEVCWRMEREYWLRTLEGKKLQNYKSQLDWLYPHSISSIKPIIEKSIRKIAFPSILESLSKEGMDLGGLSTTLSMGFPKDVLSCRLVTLTHQHRMHSKISETPRKLFYSGGKEGYHTLLLDGKEVDNKQWDYNFYRERNVWVDFKNGRSYRGKNEKEAEKLIQEVRRFKNWAAGQQKKYEVAVLTFYKGQESLLRDKLKRLFSQPNTFSNFTSPNIKLKLATVDYIQGQEADIVFLSMVNTDRDGFLDTPNRLNVAITRAKQQMVIVGNHEYYSQNSRSHHLRGLANSYHRS